jgi:hypothetical protein
VALVSDGTVQLGMLQRMARSVCLRSETMLARSRPRPPWACSAPEARQPPPPPNCAGQDHLRLPGLPSHARHHLQRRLFVWGRNASGQPRPGRQVRDSCPLPAAGTWPFAATVHSWSLCHCQNAPWQIATRCSLRNCVTYIQICGLSCQCYSKYTEWFRSRLTQPTVYEPISSREHGLLLDLTPALLSNLTMHVCHQ